MKLYFRLLKVKPESRSLAILMVNLSLFFFSPVSVYAQDKKGTALLSDGINALKSSKDSLAYHIVTVLDQPFNQAVRINNSNYIGKPNELTLAAPVLASVKSGDVLWLSMSVRSIQSKRETGESFIEVSINRIINGKYEWPPIITRGVSFGSKWTTIQIPFIAARNANAEQMSFVLGTGKMFQEFEIGDLKILNFGKDVKYEDLPRSVVHYDGDNPNAAWRKQAEARIEKYRKGDLTVNVMDKQGKAVKGARVEITEIKSAFAWGTATNSQLLLDTVTEEGKKYHEILAQNFNKIVFENEMKWPSFAKADHDRTLRALEWAKSHDMDVRGHVMVWPSWQHTPSYLLKFKNDPDGLGKEVIDHIDDQAKLFNGKFAEWDVVNEPYANHDLIDILGKSVMVDWFNRAKKDAPGVALFLNEYTMFLGSGPGSPSEKTFETLQYLKEHGAPIDDLGEQGHIGGSPPGIEFVLSRLDHFAALGFPIQISEFDITSDDDAFKARYMRDFMTAIFSHPATFGFVQWGFWEKDHWIASAALWDKNWNIKPAGRAYTQLVNETWKTNFKGDTDFKGVCKTRGFNGKYCIKVKKGNKEEKLFTTLESRGRILTVKL